MNNLVYINVNRTITLFENQKGKLTMNARSLHKTPIILPLAALAIQINSRNYKLLIKSLLDVLKRGVSKYLHLWHSVQTPEMFKHCRLQTDFQ